MICTNCSIEMEHFVEGSCCGWKCKKCNMEYVTSYFDPIVLDESEYKIIVLSKSDPSALQIKTLARLCECSFLESKERILNGFSFEGMKAKDARNTLSKLKAVDLSFMVSPKFEYEY